MPVPITKVSDIIKNTIFKKFSGLSVKRQKNDIIIVHFNYLSFLDCFASSQ